MHGAQLLCSPAACTCRHVLEVHRAATQRREVAEDEAREEAFFKRYLEFCRARVSPRLSEPAADSLVSQYVELREQVLCSCAAILVGRGLEILTTFTHCWQVLKDSLALLRAFASLSCLGKEKTVQCAEGSPR